jgi:HEAT repeat protein
VPAALPEHLPPVEPPSAGFIVQLFLVPAMIVAGVIGLYLLFGKLAAGDTDWRQLVSDIKSDNPNVRWRAALNLAEGLDTDESRGDAGQHLASIPEIATALNELAEKQLQASKRTEEQEQQLQFLMKALGRMDAIEQTWPALKDALDEKQNPEIRKQALQAIAMVAGRQRKKGTTLAQPEVLETVVAASESPDPVLRQHGAFALGLIPGAASELRLGSLLEDSDEMTRINAAIAFAREGSPRGLPVFATILSQSAEMPQEANTAKEVENRFERQVILKNTLQALEQLGPKLKPEEKAEFGAKLKPLEGSLPDLQLRMRAKEVRIGLEQPAV